MSSRGSVCGSLYSVTSARSDAAVSRCSSKETVRGGEGKGREGKGRDGKGRDGMGDGMGWDGKGREGKEGYLEGNL